MSCDILHPWILGFDLHWVAFHSSVLTGQNGILISRQQFALERLPPCLCGRSKAKGFEVRDGTLSVAITSSVLCAASSLLFSFPSLYKAIYVFDAK